MSLSADHYKAVRRTCKVISDLDPKDILLVLAFIQHITIDAIQEADPNADVELLMGTVCDAAEQAFDADFSNDVIQRLMTRAMLSALNGD